MTPEEIAELTGVPAASIAKALDAFTDPRQLERDADDASLDATYDLEKRTPLIRPLGMSDVEAFDFDEYGPLL